MILNSISLNNTYALKNNKPVSFMKNEDSEKESKDLILTLSCLAAATAAGAGIYYGIKSGKFAKLSKKVKSEPPVKPNSEAKAEIKPEIKKPADAQNVSEIKLVEPVPANEIKPAIEKVESKVVSSSQANEVVENLEIKKYMPIIEAASQKLDELSLLKHTIREEDLFVDKLLISAKKINDNELILPLVNIKTMNREIASSLDVLYSKMEAIKALKTSTASEAEQLEALKTNLIAVQEGIIKLSQLRKKTTETLQEVTPKIESLIK